MAVGSVMPSVWHIPWSLGLDSCTSDASGMHGFVHLTRQVALPLVLPTTASQRGCECRRANTADESGRIMFRSQEGSLGAGCLIRSSE